MNDNPIDDSEITCTREELYNLVWQKPLTKLSPEFGLNDVRLVEDFVRVVRGEEPSISTTNLMDSIHIHEIAYAADRAMRQGCVVSLND